jgi:hypothetical protein
MLSTSAWAQTVDIPYQGWLTLGDQPCSGSHTMVFSLYDVATGGTAVWSDTYDVTVSNGAFSAVLPVPEAVVLGNEGLYLEIEVDGTALVNRQRIYPAVYAARDMPGTSHFYVKSSADSGIAITDGYINYAYPGSTLRAGIHNDTDNSSTVGPALVIVGNRAANAGGDGKVTVLHDLRVYRNLQTGANLSAGGNATLGGNLTVGGTTFKGFQVTAPVQIEVGAGSSNTIDTGISTQNGICWLSLFYLYGHADAEDVECNVVDAGGNWRLGAANRGSQGGVLCKATCLKWNW